MISTADRTGKAAVLAAYNEPLEIREFPLPEPEPGALLVRVAAATICGTDVHAWEGLFEGILPIELPVILGHEIVGEVVAVGEGAEVDSVGAEVQPGDRVVWAHEPCGRCRQCVVERNPARCPTRRVGMLQNCERPPHFAGGFAEYSYVWPKSGRLKVPDEVKSEWASASSCALRTVINGFERVGLIDYRHSVVIQGAGPLGLFATALAATHTPRQLIVIGGPEERLEVARAWGADETVLVDGQSDREERVSRVLGLTGGGGDVVFEFSGAPGAFAEGVEMTAVGARYGVVGTVSGEAQAVLAHHVTYRELSIFGSFSGDIDAYYKALQFLLRNRHRFEWDLMLTGRYSLDELTTAVRRMKAFEEIKPVVIP